VRAVVIREFGPPEVLEPAEVAEVRAGPDEVVIEVEFANVTFVETQVRAGRPPHPSMLPALPAILGNGVGGTVGDDSPWSGARVVASLNGTGGYAERAVATASALIRVPDELATRDAVALLADGRTALALAGRVNLRAGDTVLVEAAGGGVGTLLVQIARRAGARVVALAGQPRKLALARDLGADVTVDYSRDGWERQVHDVVGEVDVVFDGVGGDIGLAAFGLLGAGGRFCPFGMASGRFAPVTPELAQDRQVTVQAGAKLTEVQAELAAALPAVWEDGFDESVEASRQLEAQRRQRDELSAAVGLSIGSALDRLKRESRTDIWAEISEADLCLLTTKRPGRVTSAYEKALARADDFAVEAARDQIELYQGLAILNENVQAALSAFPPRTAKGQGPGNARVLLFTGHRIDDPGRPKPRFPANKEDVARKALRDAIESEKVAAGEIAFGIAGGASGGDILFHEVCGELGISTKLFLAVPPEDFIKASVRSAGPQWIERFNALLGKLVARVLQQTETLPSWLAKKSHYGLWQRDNFWMLYNALAYGAMRVTLIALWDGAAGDGPGGTGDLVAQARKRGAKVVILDTKALFGLQ